MAWIITCTHTACGEQTWARNIVDLLNKHRNTERWFVCSHCGARGHIEKSFKLQEPNQYWKPFLKGAIRLSDSSNETYQPFAFLVGGSDDDPPGDVWFSYYKDLRPEGGRLKLGYGPGGPPVLDGASVVELLAHMLEHNCIDPAIVKTKLAAALD